MEDTNKSILVEASKLLDLAELHNGKDKCVCCNCGRTHYAYDYDGRLDAICDDCWAQMEIEQLPASQEVDYAE